MSERRYSDRTPLPPGYDVEWWEEDEHYHWVSPDPNVYSDGSWNHWDCWRGAWAHYRAANTVTDRVAPLSASPQTVNDRSRDTDQIPTHETPEKQA